MLDLRVLEAILLQFRLLLIFNACGIPDLLHGLAL